MKHVSFSLIGVILPLIIGQPANALKSDSTDPDGLPTFSSVIAECNGITGGGFQPAAGGGTQVISLEAGKLFDSIGFQLGDIILSVTPPAGLPHATNNPDSLCGDIVSNKGHTITLSVRDVNTNGISNVPVMLPP